MPTGFYVAVAVLVIVALAAIAMVNSLIAKKNRVENTFAGIDVQLKKRYDLIPNLVAAVQKYMTHERDVLERIAALRARAVDPAISHDERVRIDNQVTAMLPGLAVQIESYPQLRASENVLHLQRSLTEVEEQIAAVRRAYNAAVTEYNCAVEMFPSNLIAGMMGYRRHELFSTPEAERANVSVRL